MEFGCKGLHEKRKKRLGLFALIGWFLFYFFAFLTEGVNFLSVRRKVEA